MKNEHLVLIAGVILLLCGHPIIGAALIGCALGWML